MDTVIVEFIGGPLDGEGQVYQVGLCEDGNPLTPGCIWSNGIGGVYQCSDAAQEGREPRRYFWRSRKELEEGS